MALDNMVSLDFQLMDGESVTLYYICGYVAFMGTIPSDDDFKIMDDQACKFMQLVSQGKLMHPPKWHWLCWRDDT